MPAWTREDIRSMHEVQVHPGKLPAGRNDIQLLVVVKVIYGIMVSFERI